MVTSYPDIIVYYGSTATGVYGVTEAGAQWIERNLSFEGWQVSCATVWADARSADRIVAALAKTSLTIEIDMRIVEGALSGPKAAKLEVDCVTVEESETRH
jgi:hypothetical protein